MKSNYIYFLYLIKYHMAQDEEKETIRNKVTDHSNWVGPALKWL